MVPCTVGPSPKAFAKAVWEFVRGVKAANFIERFRRSTSQPGHEDSTGLDAMAFAPVALHETGAVHVFDKHGFRLQGSAELSLALPWSEVHRVALQVQHSQILGLKMLRVAFWPAYPQTFSSAHPECVRLWDPALEGYALAVVTAPEIPQPSIDLTLAGLAFAGERFNREVEQVRTAG